MKKLLFGILLIGLVSWAAWAIGHDKDEGALPAQSMATTYEDPAGRFTIEHLGTWVPMGASAATVSTPIGWSTVTPGTGYLAAKIVVPQSLYPGTNFSEAWLTVGSSNDPPAIAACLKNVQEEGMDVQDTTIDAYPFTKFSTGGAAAGNYYDTTAYHTILDGDCWAIEYTIHTTNIHNYPPEAGISEFSSAPLKAQLDLSARSFTFLVNSD